MFYAKILTIYTNPKTKNMQIPIVNRWHPMLTMEPVPAVFTLQN